MGSPRRNMTGVERLFVEKSKRFHFPVAMIFGMHGWNNGKNPFQSQEILVRNVRVLFYGELGYRDADGVRFMPYGNWIRTLRGNDEIIGNNQIMFSPYAFVDISNNRAICGGEYRSATCLQVRIFSFSRYAQLCRIIQLSFLHWHTSDTSDYYGIG